MEHFFPPSPKEKASHLDFLIITQIAHFLRGICLHITLTGGETQVARGKRNHNQVAFIKPTPKGRRLECKGDLEEKAYIV